MAEKARETLQAQGARVEFKTYEGGHGWHGDIFGMIREGLVWLDEHASNAQTKISQPGQPTPQTPALRTRK
jgi:hypothetical protein